MVESGGVWAGAGGIHSLLICALSFTSEFSFLSALVVPQRHPVTAAKVAVVYANLSCLPLTFTSSSVS